MTLNNSPAHEAIRKENLENPHLLSFLNAFAQAGAHYLPCAGNLGDGLIGLGTLQLFADLGLSIPIRADLGPTALDGLDHVIVGGGGGWVDGGWDHYARTLEPFLQRGGKALVLPSTVTGFTPFFERYGRQISFFARDRQTSDDLSRIEAMTGRVFLAHDLAFNVDLAGLGVTDIAPQHDSLKMFRADAESGRQAIPAGAPDLPSIWNGVRWGAPEQCLPPLQSVASIIVQFRTIETDRLHMAVLAAMLGRRVVLQSNSYFKNRAVFEMSLSRFDAATFETGGREMRGLTQNMESLEIQLAMQRAEIQELRARVLFYASELDRMSVSDHVDHAAPAPLLQAYLHSRGFRLWQRYLALYDLPVAGPLLRRLRTRAGRIIRFLRRAAT